MPTAEKLAGLHVVVTRPAHQANALCEGIERYGGRVIRFPVLEIVPLASPQLRSRLDRLSDYHLAVFISANAVDLGIDLVNRRGGWPPGVHVAAVGKASAKALARHGLSVDIFPSDRFDSEALLQLPALQQVKGRRILIFRGKGGRELLAQTLTARGARVDYAECYERRQPTADATVLLDAWRAHKLDIITVTSNEGLDNLYAMVGEAGRHQLLNTPLVVVSERMRRRAGELGFAGEVFVAERASDDALLTALLTWRQTHTVQ